MNSWEAAIHRGLSLYAQTAFAALTRLPYCSPAIVLTKATSLIKDLFVSARCLRLRTLHTSSMSFMGASQSRPPQIIDGESLVAAYEDRASKLTLTDPSPFLDRWRSLPEEIRVAIIAHALPPFKTRCITHEMKSSEVLADESISSVLQLITPFAAVPDIATLAYEQFYSENTVAISDSKGWGHLRYPPRSINHFVRKLDISILLNIKKLAYIRKLGNGYMGFENLVDIQIHIAGDEAEVELGGELQTSTIWLVKQDGGDYEGTLQKMEVMKSALKKMEPIVLRANKVQVTYEHADIWYDQGPPNVSYDRISDPWEMLLLDKFHLINEEGPVKETLQRSYIRDRGELLGEGGEEVLVDEWPEIQDAEEAQDGDPSKPRHFPRYTVKKLWV
ncbi:hypothetical protein IQ06DRAFT_294593 [Phaeosphaeriaceae sp. SRC1lsM3a]|nr:hypothetical protein IQ06DRAFT_294593 [Stagonospora sp. SRC1lsM3a]